MKESVIPIILLSLIVAMVLFLASIVKNKKLSINKKALWAIIVIFLPIVGGIMYFIRKG